MANRDNTKISREISPALKMNTFVSCMLDDVLKQVDKRLSILIEVLQIDTHIKEKRENKI